MARSKKDAQEKENDPRDRPMPEDFIHDDAELERLRSIVRESRPAFNPAYPRASRGPRGAAAEAATDAYHQRRRELGIAERAIDVPMFFIDGAPFLCRGNYIEYLRNFTRK